MVWYGSRLLTGSKIKYIRGNDNPAIMTYRSVR